MTRPGLSTMVISAYRLALPARLRRRPGAALLERPLRILAAAAVRRERAQGSRRPGSRGRRGRRYGPRMPAHDLPVAVTLDGGPIPSRTRRPSSAVYHVCLATVLLSPRLAIELHSSYLGHSSTRTRATHLRIAPGRADTLAVEHEHEQLPVTHARERCLLDHLQALVELATELGHTFGVELPEEALLR